jgi:hypothetical protein
MGAGSSKPSSGGPVAGGPEANYGSLIKIQERDNMAFARIFKRMVENITPKELRELYSINQCKKYHFALGQALSKIFYFTPVEGLKQQPIYWLRLDTQKKDEHDEAFFKNCFQVAYFYIRLLQIFCALSISTKSNEAIPYSGGPLGGPMGQFFRFPGMTGGAFGDGFFELTVEEILAKYVRSDGNFAKYSSMNLDGNRLTITRGTKKVSASLDYIGKNQLQISEIYYDNEPIEVKKYVNIVKSTELGYKTTSKERIDDVILDIMKRVIKNYEEKKGIVKKTGADAAPGRGAPTAERKELRVEYLVDRLSGSSNKPYAVARALQLIDLQPHESYAALDMYGRGKRSYEYTTHVFDFNYSPIIGNAPAVLSAQQLKEFGETSDTLANVLGLSALEKLHFDNWKGIAARSADGKQASGSESYRITPIDEAEYHNFLRALHCMYKDTSIKAINETDVAKGSIRSFGIQNQQKDKGPQSLKMETPQGKVLIANLQKLQRQLFGLQMSHNAQVKQFIQKYIIADTPRGPLPNPLIFQQGLPYINTIGMMARRLLLAYYVRAEAIYYQGYQLVKSGGASTGPRNLMSECGAFIPGAAVGK